MDFFDIIPIEIVHIIVSYLSKKEDVILFFDLHSDLLPQINWNFVFNLRFGEPLTNGLNRDDYLRFLNLEKLRRVLNLKFSMENFMNIKKLLILDEDNTNLAPEKDKMNGIADIKDGHLFIIFAKLGYIPSEIFDLINLKLLFIFGAAVNSIPIGLSKLTNLEILRIRMGFSSVSHRLNGSDLSINGKPNGLDLSCNKINTHLKEICMLTNLIDLDLSFNGILTVPKEIEKLQNLKTLKLRDNLIREIPPEIGNLVKLKTLNLLGNLILTVPPNIVNLVNLIHLDLSYNKILTFPPEVENFLLNLLAVSLYENPVREDIKERLMQVRPNMF